MLELSMNSNLDLAVDFLNSHTNYVCEKNRDNESLIVNISMSGNQNLEAVANDLFNLLSHQQPLELGLDKKFSLKAGDKADKVELLILDSNLIECLASKQKQEI